MEARNLLSNMLGFTRHERLDVKKPGPPAEPPPSSQSPHETPKLAESVDKKEEINKEVLPTHIKGWGVFFRYCGDRKMITTPNNLSLQIIFYLKSRKSYITMTTTDLTL